MKLSLGPIQYFWPEATVQAFYEAATDWPVDIVYLGETVCAKRRNLRLRDWLNIAERLQAAGKEVVLSTLALVEAESELSTVRRIAANGRFKIEANDASALSCAAGHPFVAGTTLNAYNPGTLQELAALGAVRWVPPVELGRDSLNQILPQAPQGLETELLAFGRMPLAFSARCFTARAVDRGKDDCLLACLEYPQGLRVRTREEEAFLNINGIQIQSAKPINLLPALPEILALGIGVVRISPEIEGTPEVIQAFHGRLHDRLSAADAQELIQSRFPETCSGYWDSAAGMRP